MSQEWFTPTEILSAAMPPLPDTLAGLNAFIIERGWRRDTERARVRFGRGGGYEYHISLLPVAMRAALLSIDGQAIEEAVEQASRPIRSALWAGFDRLTEAAKAKATQRLAAVQGVFAASEGVTRQAAVATTAAAHGVAASSLWGWLARIEGLDREDWLPALADQRGSTPRTKADIHPDAWDYFKADYLRLEEPALSACYDRLLRTARKNEWGQIPSLKTLKRRLDEEVPKAAQTLARKGREAARAMAPAQRRDRTVFSSLEAVNADGYRHNVFVRWPDGTIARPISIAFQDIRSGKWLARRTARTENKETTRLAIGDVATRYGIFEHIYFDNGRHFSSKWLTGRQAFRFRFKVKDEEPAGILTTLGVKVHFTTPYSGRSKPIERMFKDVGEYIDKHPAFAGAYTGRNPLAKPENYGATAIPLELFEQVCASEMAAHNAREGRRGFGMEGRSFDQVFQDEAPELGFRRAGPEQRRLFMLAAEGVTARKPDGRIELFENRFWCEELAERIGQKLIVRFDPQNLHEGLAIYTLDNRFIAEAARLDDIGFNSVDDAREAARLANQLERARKEAIHLSVKLDEAELKRLAPIELPTDDRPEPIRVQRLVANGAPRTTGPGLDFAALDSALGRLADSSHSGGVIPFTPKDGR